MLTEDKVTEFFVTAIFFSTFFEANAQKEPTEAYLPSSFTRTRVKPNPYIGPARRRMRTNHKKRGESYGGSEINA